MIALYLLAAHLVGDFVLQTRWQAEAKFGWSERAFHVRNVHVAVYCLPFVPVILTAWPGTPRALLFVFLLYVLHFLTDAQRFRSTVGDWFRWRTMSQDARRAEWGEQPLYESAPRAARGDTSDSLPPNPWTPIGLMIDQTLHIAQIAVLAGILLR